MNERRRSIEEDELESLLQYIEDDLSKHQRPFLIAILNAYGWHRRREDSP